MGMASQDQSTTYLYPADRFQLEVTDVRVHHVALQRWFNRRFLLREGYPCPVIFAGQMDAYAQFNHLWRQPTNPFNYLATLQDPASAGLSPAPLRFPLIAVDFKSMRYRPEQSYASRVNRRLYYPTVNNEAQGLTQGDLGNVAQARFPAAWTFSFQVDFLSARPDTRDFFIKQLNQCFRVMSAGTPQTFIPVVYPNYMGALAERLVLTSNIDDMTEKEPTGTEMRYRISVTLEIEGYAIDTTVTVAPTLWSMVVGGAALSPDDVARYFDLHATSVTRDLRTLPLENSVLVAREATLPPA